MRFQHSVGLLTSSIDVITTNNNNNSNCTDITNNCNNIYNSLFESDSNLNQTIQFTRDLNFTTKPNTNNSLIETTLHSINGTYHTNNEQELIDSFATDCGVNTVNDTLQHCGESVDSSNGNEAVEERPARLGTVKTQERQCQYYNPFEKAREAVVSTEFITSIYEQETTQSQNNNFRQIHSDKQHKLNIERAKTTFIKLDFEGNNNEQPTEQRLFNDSISSSASSTTSSVAATASTTPDDDSFLDDEDDSLSPIASSSTSHNVHLKIFPRGIINPNYPGFQHLAHRLAEHFVNHSFEQCSDSDISEDFEYDMTSPVDDTSADNFNMEVESVPQTQAFDRETDSGRQSDTTSSDNNSSVSSSSSLDFLEKTSDNRDDEELIIKENEDETRLSFCKSNVIDNHFSKAAIVCITTEEEENVVAQTTTPDILIEHNSKKLNENNNQSDSITMSKATTTPVDRKSDEHQQQHYEKYHDNEFFQWDYQPDLIKNINNETVDLKDYFNGGFNENNQINNVPDDKYDDQHEMVLALPVTDITPSTTAIVINNNESIVDSYNIQSTTSTIDIIGDFGREIEKEIGLIVSGYTNQTMIENYFQQTDLSGGSKNENEKDEVENGKYTYKKNDILLSSENKLINFTGKIDDEDEVTAAAGRMVNNKMTDAILSNANEIINICPEFDELMNNIQHHYLQKTNAGSNKHNDEQHQQFEQNSSDDSERKIDYISLKTNSNSDKCVGEPNVNYSKLKNKNSLPTAIVKPKYQKSSFDERQLPPAGCIVDKVKPWYVTSSGQHKKLPHFERKSYKLSRDNNRDNRTISEKEVLNSIRQREKDIDCGNNSRSSTTNSVAIVQPRKKEKMELNYYDKKSKTASLLDNSNCKNNDNNNLNSFAYDSKKASNNSSNNYTKSKNSGSINKCSENECSKSGKPGVKLRKTRKDVAASFDVYNIETALPVIDLEAIENHLKAAKEEERRVAITAYEVVYAVPHTITDSHKTLQHDSPKILPTTYEEESDSTFFDYFRMNNILNVRYSPLFKRTPSKSQQHDEPVESRMFPRVYATPTAEGGPWSPVALAAKERPMEELDDVVEKFIRVITVESNRKSNRNFNRRNDREEIRRRLAMGAEDDYYRKYTDKPGRKPSLHSRLQNGMNLQICFMNETASDTESPSSDSETCPKLSKTTNYSNHQNNNNNHHQVLTHNKLSSAYINPYNARPLSVQKLPSSTTTKISSLTELGFNEKVTRPTTLSLGPPAPENSEIDFFTKQAKLQIEARMALAQAKDMAHMQMEIDRQRQQISPITQIIRNSMVKVGIRLPDDKRRLSRQLLTNDINIAQLQIIVNDLHTEIEKLNEKLMNYLMERDELHMGQDSMLVDIEDLTRYLGAKEQTNHDEKMGHPPKTSPNNNLINTDINKEKFSASLTRTLATSPGAVAPYKTKPVIAQSKLSRITQLVKK